MLLPAVLLQLLTAAAAPAPAGALRRALAVLML
jgi:hypothetical protein